MNETYDDLITDLPRLKECAPLLLSALTSLLHQVGQVRAGMSDPATLGDLEEEAWQVIADTGAVRLHFGPGE